MLIAALTFLGSSYFLPCLCKSEIIWQAFFTLQAFQLKVGAVYMAADLPAGVSSSCNSRLSLQQSRKRVEVGAGAVTEPELVNNLLPGKF